MPDLRKSIEDNLNQFQYREIHDQNLRHAAVAIVVSTGQSDHDQPCVILTLRPTRLNQHSGQYALPGGKLDFDETPYEAAIRELDEELGLSLAPRNILGRLDDYPTRSKYRISPIVLWGGDNPTLYPSAEEVERVFYIPFTELDSDAIPVFEPGVDPDRPVLCCEFLVLGHRMYSPTASILYQFREVAIRGNSTRVSHFDQPKFAWK